LPQFHSPASFPLLKGMVTNLERKLPSFLKSNREFAFQAGKTIMNLKEVDLRSLAPKENRTLSIFSDNKVAIEVPLWIFNSAAKIAIQISQYPAILFGNANLLGDVIDFKIYQGDELLTIENSTVTIPVLQSTHGGHLKCMLFNEQKS
jgi:hypothetical protein